MSEIPYQADDPTYPARPEPMVTVSLEQRFRLSARAAEVFESLVDTCVAAVDSEDALSLDIDEALTDAQIARIFEEIGDASLTPTLVTMHHSCACRNCAARMPTDSLSREPGARVTVRGVTNGQNVRMLQLLAAISRGAWRSEDESE